MNEYRLSCWQEDRLSFCHLCCQPAAYHPGKVTESRPFILANWQAFTSAACYAKSVQAFKLAGWQAVTMSLAEWQAVILKPAIQAWWQAATLAKWQAVILAACQGKSVQAVKLAGWNAVILSCQGDKLSARQSDKLPSWQNGRLSPWQPVKMNHDRASCSVDVSVTWFLDVILACCQPFTLSFCHPGTENWQLKVSHDGGQGDNLRASVKRVRTAAI